MRTFNWTALSALALALSVSACGDSGSDDDTTTTTTTTTTNATPPAGTTTDPTTGGDDTTTNDPTATVPTNDSTTTTSTDPTTTADPSTTTPDPTDTDPSTTDDTTTGGALTCQAYCDIYKTGCVDFNEYDNDQACLDQCSQWPLGEAGATVGDSLGCRTYHVTVASMTEPNVHCPHAGPSGALTCVDADAPTCDDYCTEYFKNCKDDLNLYDNEDDCQTQCAPWYAGFKGQTTGDTIGCREYHSGAALGDPVVHCPHAGPGGADVCVVTP